LLAVIGMAVVASETGSGPQTSSEGSLAPALGLFVGSQAPSDVLALGKQLEVNPTIDTVYAGGSDYNSYSPPAGIPSGMTLMLGVGALTPSQATSIGDNLVAGGQSHAIIRVMWEQNQDLEGWFQGWNQLTFPTAASYIAEFQSVVTTMRAVPGQAFSFMWNPNGGTGSEASGRTWQDTWPGKSYVDLVGVDQYDYSGYAANIQAVVSFAQSQGLPAAIPEWGLNGSDDPSYINGVASIVNNPANDVVLQAYFSYPGSIDSDITQFPQSEAAFEADFEGDDGSIPAPTTTTTAPPAPAPASTTTTTAPPAPASTTTTTTTAPPASPSSPESTDTSLQIAPDLTTSAEAITASVNPIPDGGTVQVSVDGNVVGSQPLSSAGSATVEVPMSVGAHAIDATFSGDAEFASSTTSTTYSVSQAPTSLVVSLPTQVSGNSAFVLHATLTSQGEPVAGADVWFAANGSELCGGTTDQSGQVTCTVDSPTAVAAASVSATFEGDPTHLPVVAHVVAAQSGSHRHRGAIHHVHGSGAGGSGSSGSQGVNSPSGASPQAASSSDPVAESSTNLALSAERDPARPPTTLAAVAAILGIVLIGIGIFGWQARRRRSLIDPNTGTKTT
jgi:hypothetical protein